MSQDKAARVRYFLVLGFSRMVIRRAAFFFIGSISDPAPVRKAAAWDGEKLGCRM